MGLCGAPTSCFSGRRSRAPQRDVQIKPNRLSQRVHGIDGYVDVPMLYSAQMRPSRPRSLGELLDSHTGRMPRFPQSRTENLTY